MFEKLNKVTDLILVNLLFLLTCIPVFTIGAAITALYKVAFQVKNGVEGNIQRDYLSYFKSYVKKITGAWLMILGVLVLLFYVFSIYLANVIQIPMPVSVLLFFTILTFLTTVTNFFPFMAVFDVGSLEAVEQSFIIGFKNLPRTFIVMLLYGQFIILAFLSRVFSLISILFFLLIGFSVMAIMTCSQLEKSFGLKEKKAD